MSYDYSAPFERRAAVSLARPGLRDAVVAATLPKLAARASMLAELDDAGALRDLAATMRDAVLCRLDAHLSRLADAWEAAGGRVFFAADAAEARDYVVGVARSAGARTVVKSKSMASEEIGLNAALADAGIEAVETDLGEFIVQQSGEHPAHIITPAIHKSKQDAAQLFSRLVGRPLPPDAAELTARARALLRRRFLGAEVGVSGVNFAVSRTGTLVLCTNEGNGRMCTSMPPVHVAIMGMERVVADFDELAVMLALLARSATGQRITQYTSLITGPRRPDEHDGPAESHLVILDNGRSRALGTPYQEILRCIRCGACLNVCPVFRQVAGHAYDPVYSGPLGAVLNPVIRDTPRARELPHASTLCGACTEVCPVRIPLHDMLLRLRATHSRRDAGSAERAAFAVWARAWETRRRFDTLAAAGRLLGRLTRGRPLRRLPLPVLSRWTASRRWPGFPASRG